MNRKDQEAKAVDDGAKLCFCPKCCEIHRVEASDRVGVKNVELDCACGTVFHTSGYGKIRSDRRRSKRKRRKSNTVREK